MSSEDNLETDPPTFDKWGILNWARLSNASLWEAVPAARLYMLRAAAFRRWSRHYTRYYDVNAFVAYADWLHENLADVTQGSPEFMPERQEVCHE